MKLFSKYITNIEELTEEILSNNRQVTESKDISPANIPDDVIKQSNLKHVDRLILIGETYLKSIKMLSENGIKTEFACIDDFDYSIKNGELTIKSDKQTIELKSSDSENTVILVRSGYTKPIVNSVLKQAEEIGILVINGVNEVAVSSDKFLTAELLNKYGINQPKYCLITPQDIDKDDTAKAEKKIKQLYDKVNDDTKFVCKILNGHGGRGVFICRYSNIISILQCLFAIDEKILILVQEFGELKDGDVRVHVVSLNGKQEIVDSIIRLQGKSDFRTNLSLGNQMDAYELSPAQKQLALDAAKASGLVWCGVDIMPLTNGDNKIVEFNGAPGPSSNIDDKNIDVTNFKFFTKIINTINSLCK